MRRAETNDIDLAWDDSNQNLMDYVDYDNKYMKYVYFGDFSWTWFVFLERTRDRTKFFNFPCFFILIRSRSFSKLCGGLNHLKKRCLRVILAEVHELCPFWWFFLIPIFLPEDQIYELEFFISKLSLVFSLLVSYGYKEIIKIITWE